MYDLIIIGGGPSGSAAGRISGKMGLETLLLEKEVFPRYKPCGGALSEHAISYLDFDLPSSICEKDVYGARVHYKNHIIERHKNYRIATLVSRDILDNYLIKKARETGVEVKTGEKVIALKEKHDFVEIYAKDNTYKGTI
jgi:flavin-dependent dehydrogenase